MEKVVALQFIGICIVLYGYYKLVEKFTHDELKHKKDTSNPTSKHA